MRGSQLGLLGAPEPVRVMEVLPGVTADNSGRRRDGGGGDGVRASPLDEVRSGGHEVNAK